jgi:hypothetical protein
MLPSGQLNAMETITGWRAVSAGDRSAWSFQTFLLALDSSNALRNRLAQSTHSTRRGRIHGHLRHLKQLAVVRASCSPILRWRVIVWVVAALQRMFGGMGTPSCWQIARVSPGPISLWRGIAEISPFGPRHLACFDPPISWQPCARNWRSRSRRFTQLRRSEGAHGRMMVCFP